MIRSLPLFIYFFLSIAASHAQAVFRIDSLPAEGVLLNNGWKFHSGDNPEWANPSFDDSRWDAINPIQMIKLPRQLPQQGMSWLRIRLQVPPQLRGKPVGLFIVQMGATELFLNGQLVARNGQISPQKQVTSAVFQKNIPLITLRTDSVQVLAVRYAYSYKRLPFLNQSLPFLYIKVVSTEFAENTNIELMADTMWKTLLFGIFLALGVLQLLLYVASTEQRATLNLGLFLVTQGITHIIATAFLYDVLGTTEKALAYDIIRNIVFTVALTISGYCYLLGIYQYFKQPKGILFFVAFILTLATIPVSIFLPGYSGLAYFILGILVPWLEIFRIGIFALRQKKSGAKLFTIAHGILVAVFIVYTLAVFVPSVGSFLGPISNYLFIISFLGLAFTVSLLLAQERARANKLLRKQLIDLDTLSQKNLAQEQEKQQLLATQNERLEQQVDARTTELNQSLINLKSTQDQLIQKEKLASLGELTAGIAHEIQNPLNFVNNFSEVSAELVTELTEELDKGDVEEAKALASDLGSNLRKINHHGQRASSIVKGMLEHSRTSSGDKQPTNLNALADEYLKIAYHGQRANSKSFNCELVTDFDATLGKVDVIPQDIGRVLLNLYNNAFYAVQARQQAITSTDYKPTITVSTRLISHSPERALSLANPNGVGANGVGGLIEIRVRDNGTGIPDSVKAKIFQPFFTTKPTGEGTGLGLSLSYDIITKGHGGSLTVESTEGEGTEFRITLPLA